MSEPSSVRKGGRSLFRIRPAETTELSYTASAVGDFNRQLQKETEAKPVFQRMTAGSFLLVESYTYRTTRTGHKKGQCGLFLTSSNTLRALLILFLNKNMKCFYCHGL